MNPVSHEHCRCSVEIQNLTVKKHGSVILQDINLSVHHAQILALIGRNGAGKSTLLKALLGRIPYEGTVLYRDHEGKVISNPHIGYVPQHLSFDRSAPVTVCDLLCAGLQRRPVWLRPKKAVREKAAAMLHTVGARDSLLSQRLGNLSGGELQRVLLAFALEPMPDLLLLDEPVSAMDRPGIRQFYELVTSLREEYHMPVILVSHDLSHVQKYASRVALLDQTILLEGETEEVLCSEEVRETFGLPAGLFREKGGEA